MYEIQILDSASDDLRRLDSTTAARILKRLLWLAEHFDEIRPEPLSGPLAGLWKFRVGDFRVIYEVLSAELILAIHAIGHRREIYR